MAGSWLDHRQLMIIKGLGAIPTDNLSAENPPVILNLLSAPINLEANGWSPNIPATKGGGVWSDSPIADGRTLLAAPEGNVTETMNFIISDASYLTVMKVLSGLNQMVLDCRQYWQSQYQIDPVYLLWWAGCGIGPQYALISNIEIKPEYQDSPSPTIRVSMTIEREPFWRGLAPGSNPKLWTFYVNNQQIGLAGKVLADATLITGSDHLITQTIQNKHEWSPTALGLQVTPLSQNYISILDSQIPGDAPALCEMSIAFDTSNPANIYIGRSSKKYSGTGHDGVARAGALILNVGDCNPASTIVKTAGTSDQGVLSNNSAVTFYYGKRTVTGVDANYVAVASWDTGANSIKLDRQFMRGSFAIFCRCTNGSGTPVSTDMKIRVVITEEESGAGGAQYSNSFTLPETYVPAISTNYSLAYMGTVTIPFGNRATVSDLGYGIQLSESTSNLQIQLQQQVLVATANRIFNVVDLILVPIDEGMTQIAASYIAHAVQGTSVIDNTGYFTRGELKQTAFDYITTTTAGGISQEVRGQNILLKPHTNQRLYFISDLYDAGGLAFSDPIGTMAVRLNIIPRWAGIRDT